MMDGHSFDNLTDEELKSLCDACMREFSRREVKHKEKLIEDFHAAWSKLKDESIGVGYFVDDWDDECTWLTHWDNFTFT